MNFRRLTATAALAIAAMGISAGTAYAAPAPETAAPVKYEAKQVDKNVVTTLTNGTFVVKDAGKSVDVKDSAGHVLVNFPLAYNLDSLQFPMLNKVSDSGKTLTVTPVTDRSKATPVKGMLHNVASIDENQRAMGAFSAQLGIAMAVGGLVGLTVGAIAGCIIGGTPLALTLVGIPPAVLTCLGGAAIGAGVGGILGTIGAGGPTLVIAGIDLANTLTAPPGTTKFKAGN